MNIGGVNTGIDISTSNIAKTHTSMGHENQNFNLNQEIKISQQIKKDPTYIPTIQEREIIKTIEKANEKLSGDAKEFNFSIHEKTKQIMIKIIDKDTREVIKEVPPEKILDMVATMCEMTGLFIDIKK